MAYNASAVADWDKTKPVGSSETPSVLDDAIREIKECVENDLKTAAEIQAEAAAALPGLIIRPKFAWVDADQVTLEPAVIHHQGGSEQFVYWDTQLNFTFGSGGSNAGSTDLAGADFYYLAVDDSAVVSLGTNLLTNAQLIAVTTEPTWSVSKHGWYTGTDRIICGFYTGSGNLLEFFHDGEYFNYAAAITSLPNTDIDTAWADVTLDIPVFAKRVEATFQSRYVSTSSGGIVYWRTNGSSGAGHNILDNTTTGDRYPYSTLSVIADATQKIEVRHGQSNVATIAVYTNGYFFPAGM